MDGKGRFNGSAWMIIGLIIGSCGLFAWIATGPTALKIMADSGHASESRSCESGGDIFEIHAFSVRGDRIDEPFFKPGNIFISWQTRTVFDSYRIELATDPEFTRKTAILTGTGLGPCRLPQEVVTRSGRYYYRISTIQRNGEIVGPCEPKWFAVDERFTGDRIQAMGEHPLGKTEGSITVRDYRGSLYMIIQRMHEDSGGRDVILRVSDNDGKTWKDLGPVNRVSDLFSGPAAIAADPAGKKLVVGYLSADSQRMPRRVVLAEYDLTDPVPKFSHYQTFEGNAGLSWRRPFITFDKAGVAHAGWDGPHHHRTIEMCKLDIYYTNNSGGEWKSPQSLTEIYPEEPGGGTNIACAGDEVHVFWEGGGERWSDDYGKTWNPNLTEPPAMVLPDAMISKGLRWRFGSSTRIPGSDGIAMVFVGEKRRGVSEDIWTRYLNLDSLWVTVYHPNTGWSSPVCIHEIDDPVAITKYVAPDQSIHYVERPDISADGTGRIYVTWDESRGTGPDRSQYTRTGYITWTEDGIRFIDPQLLPVIGNTSAMKPLLGDARTAPGCDIAWCVGDVPPNSMRPLGRKTPFIVLGMAVATCDQLDSLPDDPGFRGEISLRDSEPGIREPGPLPAIQLPGFTGSSRAPTGPPVPTYTPVPTHTPSPTCTSSPTPTTIPWTPYQLTPDADSFIDQDNPDSNYGGHPQIRLARVDNQQKTGLIHFDLSEIPTDQPILRAEFQMTDMEHSEEPINLSVHQILSNWYENSVTFNTRPDISNEYRTYLQYESSPPLVLTNLVSDWIHNDNHGIYIEIDGDSLISSRAFLSRETNDAPILRIWLPYTPPEPTPTPRPDFAVDLQLNSSLFHSGDPFELRFQADNQSRNFRIATVWIALDAYGQYWFWPSWTRNIESVYWEMSGASSRNALILSFTWPDTESPASDIAFWGVLQDVATRQYYIDRETFGWM